MRGQWDIQVLTDRIYEAAAFPDNWPTTLDMFADSIGAMGAVMAARRSDEWTGLVVSPRIEPGLREYMASPRSIESPINQRFMAREYPGWLQVADYMTYEEWAEDPLFTDWVAPTGGDHVAATLIGTPSGEALVLQVNRQKGMPVFDDRQIACMDALRPHFARAGLLSARWRMERLRIAAEALAALGLPALVLDRAGQVLAANSLIQDKAGYLRWLPKDRIALADAAGETMFRRGLAQLNEPSPAGRSFAARTASGADPVVMHLIPLAGQARDLFDGALSLLVMTPVNAPTAPDLALIRGLFDLTPNEAKVARAITEGLTSEEIAVRHGVGSETVRSQVKAVLAKTGTANRTAAAALLGGLGRLPVSD